MALIVLPFIFSSGTTIIASQTNSNNTTIINSINGGLDNTNLTGTAGITYSNLSLGGSIVNSDISSSANISNSKINLAAISQAVTFNGNTLIGSAHQGDIIYDNGATLTRLIPGTNGQYLQTQGTSSNPQWATFPTIPRTIIGTYSDTVGAVKVNNTIVTNFIVIDSGTDWAGKNIMIIASVEYRGDTSFTATFPNIINTSATALSGMNFSSGEGNFVILALTLPTNNYTLITTHAVGVSGSFVGIAIGTNGSGNLCLVSYNKDVSNTSNAVVYTLISGTILRNP